MRVRTMSVLGTVRSTEERRSCWRWLPGGDGNGNVARSPRDRDSPPGCAEQAEPRVVVFRTVDKLCRPCEVSETHWGLLQPTFYSTTLIDARCGSLSLPFLCHLVPRQSSLMLSDSSPVPYPKCRIPSAVSESS
ncbi:hypothetical protein GN956_G22275 [Arapaima gigas]